MMNEVIRGDDKWKGTKEKVPEISTSASYSVK